MRCSEVGPAREMLAQAQTPAVRVLEVLFPCGEKQVGTISWLYVQEPCLRMSAVLLNNNSIRAFPRQQRGDYAILEVNILQIYIVFLWKDIFNIFSYKLQMERAVVIAC